MKFSLKKKTILLIVCIAAIISILAIIVYNKGIHDVIKTQYEERSIEIARLVSVAIDSKRLTSVQQAVREIYERADNRVQSDMWGTPEFEAYVSQFAPIGEMEDYQTLLADLRRMQDALNVDCLYITWLDLENRRNVYLLDAAYEDACPIGCIDPLYLENPDEALANLDTAGFAPNITRVCF